jgi:hypothetical protein
VEGARRRDEEDFEHVIAALRRRTAMRAHRAAIVFVSAVLAGPAGVVAQRQPQTMIDLSVIGEDGRPITDLKATEVTLKVGGRPRDVTFFQLLQVDDAKSAPSGAALPPPFATNAVSGTTARDVLVILDEESIAPTRLSRAQEAIRDFVGRLGSLDRVTLLSPRQGGRRITLAEDRSDIREVLGQFTAAVSNDPQHLPCRTITTLQMLQSLFTGYSARSTPVVAFVSGGIAAPPEGGRGFVAMGSGRCQLTLKHFHDARAPARALNGAFYVVYAPELTEAATPSASASSGLDTLAGLIGAEFLTRTTAEGLTRVARETSARYVLGFEPHPDDRPGARQPVELAVARERVKLRFRTEVVTVEGSGSRRASPEDMLRTGDTYTALPLHAAAFPSRHPDGKIRLVVVFEPAESGVKLKTAAVGLYDAKHRLTRWTADAADLARSPVLAGIIVPAGTYRMRVAAVDAAGRPGTVDAQIIADLVDAAPVKLSGMALGVSDASGGFSPRLQFAGSDAGAFAYLEIYGVPKGAAVSVVQEVAPAVDGPALASYPVDLAPGATDDSRIAYAGFAIDALPPGDVVVRALVSLDGKQIARLVRTLRKGK